MPVCSPNTEITVDKGGSHSACGLSVYRCQGHIFRCGICVHILTRAVKGDFSNFTRYVFGNQEVKLESSCKIIDLLSFTASFQL